MRRAAAIVLGIVQGAIAAALVLTVFFALVR